MKTNRRVSLTLLAFTAYASSARAGTITYNLAGTLQDGAALSGTMTIDNVAGTATAVDFIVGAPDSEAFTVLFGDQIIGGDWLIEASLTGQAAFSHPSFNLVLPTTTLVGYTGGSICTQSSLAAQCNNGSSAIVVGGTSIYATGTGSATAVAAGAPEPASLLLGVSALAGMALFTRRRRVNG